MDILTTEHWSLLSTRTLGYLEIFNRATIFVTALSATVVALAFLAQATSFGRATLAYALVLLPVPLLIGVFTFARVVRVNFEDTRWMSGMDLLRHAYLEILPGLEPYFVTGHDPGAEQTALAHGSRQRLANLGSSLTTTSGVVAALNSVLAGSIAGAIIGLIRGAALGPALAVGAGVSLISGFLHVGYAAWFRKAHRPVPHS